MHPSLHLLNFLLCFEGNARSAIIYIVLCMFPSGLCFEGNARSAIIERVQRRLLFLLCFEGNARSAIMNAKCF